MIDQAYDTYCDEVLARLAHMCVEAAQLEPQAGRQFVMTIFRERMRGACTISGYQSGLPVLYPARVLIDLQFEGMNAQSLLWKLFNRNNFRWVTIKALKAHFDGLVWALGADGYHEFRQECRARISELEFNDHPPSEIRPIAPAGRAEWRPREGPALAVQATIWCCQSNGNLSPPGRSKPKPDWGLSHD